MTAIVFAVRVRPVVLPRRCSHCLFRVKGLIKGLNKVYFYVLLSLFSASLFLSSPSVSAHCRPEWLLRPWQQISLSAASRERLARLLIGTYLGRGPTLESQRGGGQGGRWGWMMGGGGQGHVADVGKQYPALSWHQGRECTTPEISRRPGHTQTGTKGRHTHIDICIHARTHTQRHTRRQIYTDY